MKRFYLHCLGCPKNDVDADYLAGYLCSLEWVPTDNPEEADLLIVNSCAFIQPAKEESIEAIMSFIEIKKKRTEVILAVTGCLSQRYSAELTREIPELDGIIGLDNITTLRELLTGDRRRVTAVTPPGAQYRECGFDRALLDPFPYAYIKISDGCNNRCAYCAIPDIRGSYRSRRLESIINEARYLLDQGKKELILVSQDSTAYGRDIYGEFRLLPLLDELTALPGKFWLRLLYLHPARVTDELIDYVIDNPGICSYFDLPLQHIDDKILRAMNRAVTRRETEAVIDRIRSRRERSAIRTSFIAGFPGESEKQFETLCRFVEDSRFDRLGAFVYSPEEGTPATAFAGQVPEKERERRYHTLMEIQREIALDKNERDIGQRFEVIIDLVDKDNGYALGRSQFDTPEIDQTVRLNETGLQPGDFIPVIITGCEGYDLAGTREEP